MRFVNNGPDIPLDLLQQHQLGNVIFLCGSGVSFNCGLPLFQGLVKKIYENLGQKEAWKNHPAEQSAFNKCEYDRVLETLEQRLIGDYSNLKSYNFIKQRIINALKQSLEPKEKSSLAGHKNIVELSKNQKGEVRVITTNFDILFEKCTNENLSRHVCPDLPKPRTSDFDGIIYLHGCIEQNRQIPSLVLMSSEFADAYLGSGWATKYVYDLIRCYTIVMIGYQAEDPPMRYLLDMIKREKARYPDLKNNIYAFTSYKENPGYDEKQKGKEFQKELWEAKGIIPILYSEDNYHQSLYDTLSDWCSFYKNTDKIKYYQQYLSKNVFIEQNNHPSNVNDEQKHILDAIMKSSYASDVIVKVFDNLPETYTEKHIILWLDLLFSRYGCLQQKHIFLTPSSYNPTYVDFTALIIKYLDQEWLLWIIVNLYKTRQDEILKIYPFSLSKTQLEQINITLNQKNIPNDLQQKWRVFIDDPNKSIKPISIRDTKDFLPFLSLEALEIENKPKIKMRLRSHCFQTDFQSDLPQEINTIQRWISNITFTINDFYTNESISDFVTNDLLINCDLLSTIELTKLIAEYETNGGTGNCEMWLSNFITHNNSPFVMSIQILIELWNKLAEQHSEIALSYILNWQQQDFVFFQKLIIALITKNNLQIFSTDKIFEYLIFLHEKYILGNDAKKELFLKYIYQDAIKLFNQYKSNFSSEQNEKLKNSFDLKEGINTASISENTDSSMQSNGGINLNGFRYKKYREVNDRLFEYVKEEYINDIENLVCEFYQDAHQLQEQDFLQRWDALYASLKQVNIHDTAFNYISKKLYDIVEIQPHTPGGPFVPFLLYDYLQYVEQKGLSIHYYILYYFLLTTKNQINIEEVNKRLEQLIQLDHRAILAFFYIIYNLKGLQDVNIQPIINNVTRIIISYKDIDKQKLCEYTISIFLQSYGLLKVTDDLRICIDKDNPDRPLICPMLFKSIKKTSIMYIKSKNKDSIISYGCSLILLRIVEEQYRNVEIKDDYDFNKYDLKKLLNNSNNQDLHEAYVDYLRNLMLKIDGTDTISRQQEWNSFIKPFFTDMDILDYQFRSDATINYRLLETIFYSNELIDDVIMTFQNYMCPKEINNFYDLFGKLQEGSNELNYAKTFLKFLYDLIQQGASFEDYDLSEGVKLLNYYKKLQQTQEYQNIVSLLSKNRI